MPFDGAGFGYNESLHKLDTVIDLLETPAMGLASRLRQPALWLRAWCNRTPSWAGN